jgi:serine/threonine protein kinase
MQSYSWVETDNEYAIKYYNCDCQEFRNEVRILSLMRHPNIISLICTLLPTPLGTVGIVLSNEDQNLSDWLENSPGHNKMLSNLKIKVNYLEQISSAIAYLHLNHIFHLDLKLDNIMVTNHHIKIIDFGSAEYVDDGIVRTFKVKCTPTHRPPEGFGICRDVLELDEGFDVWSWGIIMFELFSGQPIYLQPIIPFYEDNLDYLEYEEEIYRTIILDSFKSVLNDILPPYFMSCFHLDSKERPRMKDIIIKIKELDKNL